MYCLLFLLLIAPSITGLGIGLKSMVMPAPRADTTVPLGVKAVSDVGVVTASNTTTSAVAPLVDVETPSVIPFEFFLRIAATASNILLQLSPLRLVTEVRLAKSTLSYSAFPLVALTACGYQWSFYGYFAYTATDNVGFLFLVHANVLALVLGLYYLWVFHQFQVWPTSSILQSGMLMLLFVAEYVYCHLVPDVNKALFLAGLFSAAISILVSASPMVAIPEAVKTQSTKSLPVDMCAASLLSSVLWLFVGMRLGDTWVWVPNLVGVAVGAVQIGFIVYLASWPSLNIKWRTDNVYAHTDRAKKFMKSSFAKRQPATGETD